MKKLAILALAVLAVNVAFAQPDVTSAYNANKAGKFEDAVTYIEKASADPKATSKEKYWRYRGNIYLNVAKDPSLSAKYANALQTAIDSYIKGLELDTHGDYKGEVQLSMSDAQGFALTNAETQYRSNDFCAAADNFDIAARISQAFSIVDSAAIFNSGFCFDKCGKTDKALAAYQRSGEIGYNVPVVYMYSAEIYMKNGQKDQALKVLSDARAKYPKDANLLRTEVNIYLNENQYEKAEALLKSLTETDPSNESVWFVLGVTYEKLGKKSEEEQAYRSALNIKPDYFDALFNLGAMYFNQGLELEKTCDGIKERSKYDDCIAQSRILFAKSLSELEKAYVLDNSNREIMSALKDAYYKNDNMDGYNRMKEQLSK